MEIWKFFRLVLHTGVARKVFLFKIKNCIEILLLVKCGHKTDFELLLRFIYFSTEERLGPFIENKNLWCCYCFLLIKNVVFYECKSSLTKIIVFFHDWLLFRQYLPVKSYKYGIKHFKPYNPIVYTYNFRIYSDKVDSNSNNEAIISELVVINLVNPYISCKLQTIIIYFQLYVKRYIRNRYSSQKSKKSTKRSG